MDIAIFCKYRISISYRRGKSDIEASLLHGGDAVSASSALQPLKSDAFQRHWQRALLLKAFIIKSRITGRLRTVRMYNIMASEARCRLVTIIIVIKMMIAMFADLTDAGQAPTSRGSGT